MSVYLSAAARDQVQVAQAQLVRHTESSADGRCPACAEEGPCAARRAALRVFDRYGRLPRRWPGASRPGRVAASRRWPGWLSLPVETRRASD